MIKSTSLRLCSLAVVLCAGAYAQFTSTATRIIRGNGAPSSSCATLADVSKVYFQLDSQSTNHSFYMCSQTGVGTFAWEGPFITAGVAGPTGGYSTASVGYAVGTTFFPPAGGNAANATETLVQGIAPVAGTISNLAVKMSANVTNTIVFTFRKNAADQAVTCTITGANSSCTDVTHNFTVAAGDLLAIKAVISGGTVTGAIVITYTTPGVTGPTGPQGMAGTNGTNGTNGAISRIYNSGSALPVEPFLNFVNGGCVDNAGATRTDCTLAGGGATIPSTTNLIKGDGAGNGADSGIAPNNVPLLNPTTNNTFTAGKPIIVAASATNPGLIITPTANPSTPVAGQLNVDAGGFLTTYDGSNTRYYPNYLTPAAKTLNYQVLNSDFEGCTTLSTASAITFTLVASGTQPANGQCVYIVNFGANSVTIARSGQNINGAAANLTLPVSSASAPTSAFCTSDGTNYLCALANTVGGNPANYFTSGTLTGIGTASFTPTHAFDVRGADAADAVVMSIIGATSTQHLDVVTNTSFPATGVRLLTAQNLEIKANTTTLDMFSDHYQFDINGGFHSLILHGEGGLIFFGNNTPTISGFGTSPSVVSGSRNGAGQVNVGTGGTATSGVVALTNSGTYTGVTLVNCFAEDITSPVAHPTWAQFAFTGNGQVTISTSVAWAANDIVSWFCVGVE